MFNKRAFSLMEILLATLMIGVLIVAICGVFVSGINAIKLGRYQSTALNIADKKILQANQMMEYIPGVIIRGSLLRSILTEGDSQVKKVTINNQNVLDPNTYIVFAELGTQYNIETEGVISVKGTTDYNYKLTLSDYNYPAQLWIKKARVEVTWVEQKGNTKKIFLETLISRKKGWPTPTP